MNANAFARVVIESPLLSLDREFDYLVPNSLPEVPIGSQVQVNLGKSAKTVTGYVVGYSDSSEFKAREIAALDTKLPVLPTSLYELLRTLADRSVCSLGDLLKSAIPNRMVRVEKRFSEVEWAVSAPRNARANRTTEITFNGNSSLCERAWDALQRGESVILVTPTTRSHELLAAQLRRFELPFLDFSGAVTASQRYENYLTAQTAGAHLVVGNRGAALAPVQNLGLIAVLDESDDALTDQATPYLAVRDIALVRSQLSNCDLHFASCSRSTDVQRLIELGYLVEESKNLPKPKIAFDVERGKGSGMAYAAIREGLEHGAVLVQVQTRGIARSAFCRECSTRAHCKKCGGPIWIDANSIPRCRWCNSQNLDFKCQECGSPNLRQGAGGSTRTVAEFGKSFPGMQIVESSADSPKTSITSGRKIVVATPGSEPIVESGYAAVVILDADLALHADSLRASERAVYRFAKAISLLATEGRAVIAGVPQKLGQQLSSWNLSAIASDELTERRELNFPPHVRLASLQGEGELLAKLQTELVAKLPSVEVLGPIQIRNRERVDSRLVIKYSYGDGIALATELRSLLVQLTAPTKNSRSGRNQRAIKVRMDDAEVI